MVSLKWCCSQDRGIKIVEPSDNLSIGYTQKAGNFLGTMSREKNLAAAISACYYSMYYSLYAVMMKIGIKCEIHTCSLEFMNKMLNTQYSSEDMKLIDKAFELRNTTQYYVDRIIKKEDSEFIISNAPFFVSRSKEILSNINQKDIEEIRNKIKEFIKK